MTNRLFIALEIPDAALQEIIEIRNRIYGIDERVRWEPVQKLHITLKFLGDVEDSLTQDIIESLDKITGNFNAFYTEFDKFGLFYRNDSPRILWIGTAYSKKLKEIQNSIDDAISGLGFEKEKRKFRSHLTLLRVKGNEDKNKLEKFRQVEFKPIKFLAQNIELIKSELKPAGSVYTIIKSFKLN